MSKLYPQLRDCRTKDIVHVLGVVYPAPHGAEHEDEKVWRALALMLDDELRFRDPRRKPMVKRSKDHG